MAATGFAHLSLVPDIMQGSDLDLQPFFTQAENAAKTLEDWTNDPRATVSAPLVFAAARARLRIILAECEYVRHVVKLSGLALADSARLISRLDGLEDRFHELDDSLSWAVEAPDAIKRLALEETGA